MTTLNKVETNSHWYTKDGQPQHDADLRRARKEFLFPSVTSVLQTIAKPSLDVWKQNQAILAALTLPRIEGESDDSFAKRVVEDSKQHSLKAMEFGTRIHAGCEAIAINGALTVEEGELYSDCIAHLQHFQRWKDENISEVIAVEKIVVHEELGYAGKVDLIAVHKTHGLCVIDMKTQGIKDGKKATFYDEWLWQLIAYSWAIEPEAQAPKLVSVAINSTKAEPVIEKVWPVEEYADAWEIFKSALTIWKLSRGYDPVRNEDSCWL